MTDVEDEVSPRTKEKGKTDGEFERFHTFLGESTIHGLQNLHKSQDKRRRIVWIIGIILIWILVCAHFAILISSFISNETSIDMRIVDARVLEFPAVTICNANPIKKSALEASAANNPLLQQLMALDGSDRTKKKRRRKRERNYKVQISTTARASHSPQRLSTVTERISPPEESHPSSPKLTTIPRKEYLHSTTVSSSTLTSRPTTVEQTEYFQPAKISTDRLITISAKSTPGIKDEYSQSTPDTPTLTNSRSIPVTRNDNSRFVTHPATITIGMPSTRTVHDYNKILLSTSTETTGKLSTYLNTSLTEKYFGSTSKQITPSSAPQYLTTESLELSTETLTPTTGSNELHFEKSTRPDEYEEADQCSSSKCKHGGACVAEEGTYSCICTPEFQGTHCELGLEVGLNIGQKDIYTAAGGVAGAVIVVHSKDAMPFPEDYGTVLTPGVYNSIKMQLIKIKRLPYPYGDCISTDIDSSNRDVYTSLYNVTYSKSGCEKTCHQRHVIDKCNCAIPNYPRVGVPFGDSNVSLCDEENNKQKLCKDQIGMALGENKLKCDCPNPCHEDLYVASKSSSQWPMQKRMKGIIQDMEILYPDLFKGINTKTDIFTKERIMKQNFLKATIFYDDLSHEKSFQFAGDVGGMLGLWIGVSAMGIIHVIEFVLAVIYSKAITNLKSTRKVEDIHPSTP
ncbi:hypothetical protein LSH36_960g00003 [Paralvinella palmiformis]|uniref:EGF-like domain-containing protein n=1 Tax=Paralvinella palmiformis TaxID=53620 RepID=A0AAD9IWZ3_9ANNE|nr:hypothetical protein LSH36_960g00003 [Paralvinella palmiformis]